MATFPKLVIRQGFWGKRTWHISTQLLSRHFFLHWGNQQRLSVCIDCNRPRQNLVYAVHKSKRGFCYKRPVILDTTEPIHISLLSTPQVRKSETGFSPPGLEFNHSRVPMWDLYTKWQWSKFLSEFLQYDLLISIPPLFNSLTSTLVVCNRPDGSTLSFMVLKMVLWSPGLSTWLDTDAYRLLCVTHKQFRSHTHTHTPNIL